MASPRVYFARQSEEPCSLTKPYDPSFVFRLGLPDGRPTKLMRAAGISTEGERPKIVDSYEKPGVRPKTPEPK